MDKGKLAPYWHHWHHWHRTGTVLAPYWHPTGTTGILLAPYWHPTGTLLAPSKARGCVAPYISLHHHEHPTYISKLLYVFSYLFYSAVFTGTTARHGEPLQLSTLRRIITKPPLIFLRSVNFFQGPDFLETSW